MPLRRHRRQYEQMAEFERGRIIEMREARWLAWRVSRQLGAIFFNCDEVLGLVDRRDAIYMATKLKTPSIDQSSRKQSYHTTRTPRGNCLIGRCPDTSRTFTTGSCACPNHRKVPG
ncbi:hypothetical protein TNCV_1930101 [Trichonephila clavipes]|nr:hypothetical protein TNCV_1930101 [Trichonephila clavipes]